MFISELKYRTARGSDMYLHLVGTYHNDTLVKITGFTKERKSSGSTSSSQHKYLYVYSINQNGFESQMEFKTNTGTQMKYPIKGEYHNETTVKLTGWSDEPQYAEIQVCNDNKFLRIKLQELDDILILTHEARLIVDVNINAGQLKMEYVP
ncbi:hypothetical protein PV325_005259 [Microctonus aethiopoides]|nr:hypothetical protein PV325_005259 [Microctonus aethiopoides]